MKNNRLLLRFAIAIVFCYAITAITGCHDCKPCCDFKSLYILDARLNDYFFKPGSSWVYKETTSLQTDSQYLYAITDSLVKNDERCGQATTEEKFFSFLSLRGSTQDSFVFATQANSGNVPYLVLLENFDFNHGYGVLQLDMTTNQTKGIFKYLGKLSSVAIDGNNFSDVMMFKIMTTADPLVVHIKYPTEYWFSPHVGIVKKIVDDPNGIQTWNLQRWSVIQ